MFLKLAFLVVLGLAFEKVCADEPDSIVGGTNASPGEFPYQASLRFNGQHICGGTIVSPTQIVTAAHCIVGLVTAPYNNFFVVTGSTTLNAGGQTHRVRNVRVHPNYRDSQQHSWANDAALITLAQPMQFNQYQRSIPLATSDPPLNAPLMLSGWGKTSTRGGVPNQLQKATVYYVSNQQCQNAHPGMPIYNTHLCALHSRGIGACQGDSGGPLVHNGRLTGIVSWVLPCAVGVPDAYTRVSQMGSFFVDVPRG